MTITADGVPVLEVADHKRLELIVALDIHQTDIVEFDFVLRPAYGVGTDV